MKTSFGSGFIYHKPEAHMKHISGAHSAYNSMFNTVNSTAKRLSCLLDILFLLGDHSNTVDLGLIVRFFADDVNCLLTAEHFDISDELFEDETELHQHIYHPNQTYEEIMDRVELTFKPDYTQLPSLIIVEKLILLALIEADQTHWNKFLESLAQVDMLKVCFTPYNKRRRPFMNQVQIWQLHILLSSIKISFLTMRVKAGLKQWSMQHEMKSRHSFLV
jgi:hypothetical protein